MSHTNHSIQPASQIGPVEESLNHLEMQAAAVRESVNRILTRLAPILTPEAIGTEGSQGKTPRPMTAQLVSKIDGLTEFLGTSYADLQEIERRLAL